MIRKGIIVTRDGMRLLGGPGSGNFGHGGIPGQRGGSAQGGGSSEHVDSVKSYLGVEPKIKSYVVLSKEEFDSKFNSNTVTGMAGAITLPNNEIYIREGSEDSGIHELVHASGFIPDPGASSFINEGLTQIAAEEIGSGVGVDVKSSYKEEVRFCKDLVIPATGMDKQQFFKEYASAQNKTQFLTDKIYENNKDVFSDTEDWGKNVKQNMEDDLRRNIGTSVYLNEISAKK